MKKFLGEKWFPLVMFVLPVVILFSFWLLPMLQYSNAPSIQLRTNAFIYQDPFLGDYYSLDFEISKVRMDQINDDLYQLLQDGELYNQTVYVGLKEVNGIYEIDKVGLKKPESAYYIEAIVSYYNLPSEKAPWDFAPEVLYLEIPFSRINDQNFKINSDLQTKETQLSVSIRVEDGGNALQTTFISDIYRQVDASLIEDWDNGDISRSVYIQYEEGTDYLKVLQVVPVQPTVGDYLTVDVGIMADYPEIVLTIEKSSLPDSVKDKYIWVPQVYPYIVEVKISNGKGMPVRLFDAGK